MNFLQKIIPINLLEEKEKFFSDNSYNPQFLYAENIQKERLYKYGKPKQLYLDLAQQILDKAYFNKNEQDLLKLEGNKLFNSQILSSIEKYLLDYQLQHKIAIVKSKSFIARTAVDDDKILLRLPLQFREKDLQGMMNHEIATHILRKINYQKQPWYKDRDNYNFADYSKTEEGLAVFHTLIATNCKLAHKISIYYLAIYYSQIFDFATVWKKLCKYVKNKENLWLLCMRGKRGMQDTSSPGGYTKDIMYLEGMVDMFIYLLKNNFDISKLYFGKIALEDIDKAVQLSPSFKPILPIFFTSNKQKYAFDIEQIAKENNLHEL